MQPEVRRWFSRRTFLGAAPPVERLVARKAGQRISVVLPARNEAATVGSVVAAVVPLIDAGLVDELVVIDDGSSDATAAAAADAGARVVGADDVLPAHGPDLTGPVGARAAAGGKGAALWKALFVTDGDLVVYLDADLTGVTPDWVTRLVWPLLTEPDIAFVKACYDRPLAFPGQPERAGGGRVTELAARPLLDVLWPQLAGVIQPLAGEYAARRSLLETLSYEGGYAVELGLLLDALGAVGLDGLAQVDLGVRRHRHQGTEALGRMAAGIVANALARAGVGAPGTELVQFGSAAAGFAPSEVPLRRAACPPMISVPEYAARRARAS